MRRNLIMQTKVLALILVGLAALPAAASAKDSRDATFCAAIGLTQETARTCTQQLNDAASPRQRSALQATWVSKSPMMDKSKSLYASGTDSNRMNGRPGTVYQGKAVHLSNRVNAQINRAVATVKKNELAKRQQVAMAQDLDR
jgi:hypothetical protein